MEERCRLCLSEDISEESIFDSRNDGFSLSSKIMICTSLLVTAEDQYSKNICSNCADMLDLFFDFRNNCFKTHISMYNALHESPEECHLMEQMNGEREEDESIYENDKMKYKTNYSEKLKDVIETDGNGCLVGNVTEVLSTALVEKVTSEEVVLEVKEAKGLSSERHFQVGCYLTEEGDQDGSQLMRRFKCINCKKVFSSLVELDGHWHLCQAKLDADEAGEPPLKEFIVDDEDMAVEEEEDGAVYEEEEEAEDELMNEEEEGEEEEEEGVVNKKNGRPKQYYCKSCGKVFKQNSLLTRHIQVKHIKVRPYSCSDCPRRFFDKYELKYHQRLHQDVEDFVCNVCGRRFARRSGLKAHMRSHTGEKPFECTSCYKSFAHLNSLYTHERVHTGERPYTCQYCPRTFAQYSTAKSHEEMHMGGLRPHQCSVCDRMFRSESELRCHFISHEGAADHRCSICNRAFKKKAELKNHTHRYHSENRPYGCKHCPKTYLSLRELKCHETLHTGETPFTCLFCSRKYRLKGTLRKHMEKHHRGHLPGATLDPVSSCSINLSIF